jgi:hypothetical protein
MPFSLLGSFCLIEEIASLNLPIFGFGLLVSIGSNSTGLLCLRVRLFIGICVEISTRHGTIDAKVRNAK